MTYRNPLLIQFFTCFSIWLFVFLFCHYHDSMTAIFILCLEFLFQFFVNPGLLIIYMIPFYSWFNRCNCDKSHFFFFFFCFDLKLLLQYSSLPFECSKMSLKSSLLKYKCLLLSFEYKKFIWCCVSLNVRESSKCHQLREDHSVKNLNWRLPTGILKTGKISTKQPTTSRLTGNKCEIG